MKNFCPRCNKEELIYYRKKHKIYMCSNCYNSLNATERRKKGLITKEERIKSNLRSRNWYKNNKTRHREHALKYYHKHKEFIKVRRYIDLFRKEIFESKGKFCCECNNTKNLEIHHLHYKHKYTPKDKQLFLQELLNMLEVLCMDCHKKKHRLENQGRNNRK